MFAFFTVLLVVSIIIQIVIITSDSRFCRNANPKDKIKIQNFLTNAKVHLDYFNKTLINENGKEADDNVFFISWRSRSNVFQRYYISFCDGDACFVTIFSKEYFAIYKKFRELALTKNQKIA